MNAFLNTAIDVHEIDPRAAADGIAAQAALVQEGVEPVSRAFAALALVALCVWIVVGWLA